MNKFTLFLCFLYVLNAADTASADYLTSEEWKSFKTKFSKSYHSPEEEKYRFNVFMKNKHFIDQHNEKFYKDEETFEVGINDFSDLLHEEFVNMTGRNIQRKVQPITRRSGGNIIYYKPPRNYKLPRSVNWTAKGVVTSAKIQGKCWSCWAFSAIGSIEGQHAIKTRRLVELSVQELIDCTNNTKYQNLGCTGGGSKEMAFEYVKDHGVATDEFYPYIDGKQQCKRNKKRRPGSHQPEHIVVKGKGYVMIRPGDEEALKSAVAEIGPISVSFLAAYPAFDTYKTGIYRERRCRNVSTTNHAMLIVGYGTAPNGKDYWLVKNSWSNEWGQNGFGKVARNSPFNCGIASYASYPLL